MLDIRRLNDRFAAAPQIAVEDLVAIKEAGFGFVVNNRPEGEEQGQPTGAEIEAAAVELGLGYYAIPVDHSGFNAEQVAALTALLVSPRPILAYCRSGTRSTMLYALAAANHGQNIDEIIEQAASAGYNVEQLRPLMESLAPKA